MTRDADAELRRPFLIGVLAAVIGFVLLGGILAVFGSGADRPEGVAERWLADVGDTTRKGVREQAARRAEEVGPLSLAAHLLPTTDTDGKAAFTDLEVGRAATDGTNAEVPFRLHPRIDGDAGPAVDGTVTLVRTGDDWKVTAVGPAVEGRTVPSDGGDPAAKAPFGVFVGALALGALVTIVCSWLVRTAERSAAPVLR